MKPVKNISQKETIELLNKCWMTHDGMWFFHCLQKLGIEETNRINKSAIKSLSSIEIERIKNMLGFNTAIENNDDFIHFFKKASSFIIPDFMNVTFGYSEHNKITWEFAKEKCFAYVGVKRLGVIDKYECGVLYRIKCWLEALGINYKFAPESDLCLMHHKGYCSGEIQLFLQNE